MKLYELPNLLSYSEQIFNLVEINLSNNNLFDSTKLFEVITLFIFKKEEKIFL